MDEIKSTLGSGWDRTQLSLRLTPQRRAELLALCRDADGVLTPTDAIDKALAVAKRAVDENARGGVERDAIAYTVDAGIAGLREALGRQTRDIELISSSLRSLHRLLSSVLHDTESDAFATDDSREEEPQSFHAWLEGVVECVGMKAQRVVIARSTWQRRADVGQRWAALDVMAELVAVDGKVLPTAGAPYPRLSRINLLSASGPICAASFPQPMFLVCQVQVDGWTVHLHRETADRQPGDAIGSHRV